MKHTIQNHPRNQKIAFDAKRHRYTYDNSIPFKGITSLIGKYTKPFNAKEIAKNLSENSPNWWHLTPEEIMETWNEARKYGNFVDEVFDNWLNFNIEVSKPELNNIKEALKEKELTPIVNEWVIYDERLKRASAIDMICERDGKIVIVDLKSMEKPIKKTAYKDAKMSYPLNSLPDCKYYKQALQVGFYKKWLQELYDVPVSEEKYVLRIRPDLYEWIPLPDVEQEIEKLYKFENED